MKNLKKLLCGALSLTTILALAACGARTGGDHDDLGASGGESPSSALASTASMGPWTTAGKVSSWAWRRPD